MNPSERFRINRPTIVDETIDGEVIILNLDRGRYYSLTAVGADAWSAIEPTATVGEILETMVERYEGDREEIVTALLRLLEEFRQEELIVPAPVRQAAETGVGEGGTCARPETNCRSDTIRPVFIAPLLQTYTDMEDLLMLDPIHEVDETGWPAKKPDGQAPTS